MKKTLLLFLLCFPLCLTAQDDSKYLAGAVPVVDGKVVFTKTIDVPGASKNAVFGRIIEWAKKRFVTDDTQKGRVLYSDETKGDIACYGEEYLTFNQSALSIDRTLVTYQTIITTEDGRCNLKVTAIHYRYNVSTKNEPERYSAEEIITDKYTLNKAKDKIYKKIGKFRIFTIDMVEKIFDDATAALGVGQPTATTAQTTYATVAKPAAPATPSTPAPQRTANIPTLTDTPMTASPAIMAGYRRIAPDKIPGNVIKLISEDWMLITAGNDSQYNTMTASWGGLGELYNKPVSICFIRPSRYTYEFMERGDYYTLSFYTEAYRDALNYCGTHSGRDGDKAAATGLTPITTPFGAKAFGEAWLILECKKTLAQSLIPEALNDPELKKEWTGQSMHKMYIGEIVNVWVK